MFLGQKIRLWKYHAETLQFLIDQQYMLIVIAQVGESHFTGTLEDSSVYNFENGSWWSESSEGEVRLDMAVHVWNTAMRKPEGNMRVILLPEGNNIEPDGDVEKCEKHNRYYFSRGSCISCRVDAQLASRASY